MTPGVGSPFRLPTGRLAPWVFALPAVEIRAGYRSAIYFDRARRILRARNETVPVTIQVFQRHENTVVCGIDEALAVFTVGAGVITRESASTRAFDTYLAARDAASSARTGSATGYLEAVRRQVEAEEAFNRLWQPARSITVRALRDGDIVQPWEPVLEVTGAYSEIAHLESVYLGVLARRSLVATNVSHAVQAAAGKPLIFFADRYDHWAAQGGDGYAAYIGGAKGVATDAQAVWGGGRALGTIPHSLIAAFGGDTLAAMRAFARHLPELPLIALVDFNNDSVATAVACAEEFGEHLWGVRLDTSNYMIDRALWGELGDFSPTGVNPRLVEKVREALDKLGHKGVRIVVSGGFTAAKIETFVRQAVPVDVFAVGSSLLKGECDYTADVVLRQGLPCSKSGRRYRPSPRLERVDIPPPDVGSC